MKGYTNTAVQSIEELAGLIDDVSNSIASIHDASQSQAEVTATIASQIQRAVDEAGALSGGMGQVAEGLSAFEDSARETAEQAQGLQNRASSLNMESKAAEEDAEAARKGAARVREATERLNVSISGFKC